MCLQHDEHGSSEHGGRSSVRRGTGESSSYLPIYYLFLLSLVDFFNLFTDHSRWSDPKEQSSDRFKDKVLLQQPRADDSNAWKHDGFYELEKEVPSARKRPAFREKKVEAPPAAAAAANGSEATRVPAARREERAHYSRGFENKPDRPLHRADERSFRRGDGSFQRGDTQRGGYQARDRFGGGGTWGQDRFNGRYGERSMHRPGGFQAEKWKHDLFDDANKSPPPKNEEEQIAKVEALLAQ